MALYPKNQEPLNDELFRNPTSEYRGTPFWAWNCRMTEEKITRIADALHDMGMGGGHLHCRTGLDTPYMSREFLDLIKDAHRKLTDRGMLTWLYDEDRFPSGAAGGLVTKDDQYRNRFLVFSPDAKRKIDARCRLLAHYQVRLADGWLADYRRMGENEKPENGYQEWFAYLQIEEDNTWYNNQAYVNTLDKKAMQRFLEVTHEVYAKELGDEFDKTIPAIFSDEPQFNRMNCLRYADEKMDLIFPYTDDLEETFVEAYGYSLLDRLPELFWERKEQPVSQVRYHYHDHVTERFVSAFTDTVGKWCEDHHLMLTGHMMEEYSLESQTCAVGDVMRSYRSFQLPGIDMLFDKREFTTAKQAQSASRQFGCPGVLSEIYGVTRWDFDFRGHKLQGDWQAALGVTVRVHHLAWTSMAGEGKRDYPACIGYQSPWYREYPYIEDYFSRLNTFLTRGKAEVKVGVIHPVESYWLYWGSKEKTGAIRREMDRNFENLVKWLIEGLVDFDFIAESLLPGQNRVEDIIDGDGFPVGEMNYEVILVPNCVTLRRSTLERLNAWQEKGGKLIFAGEIPSYIDALLSDEAAVLAEKSRCIPFSEYRILEELEPVRQVEVLTREGEPTKRLVYQMRKEGENRIFFLAQNGRMENPDLPGKEELTLSIKGKWQAEEYQPLDGTHRNREAVYRNGKTVMQLEMYEHDSLLLYLTPCENVEQTAETAALSLKQADRVKILAEGDMEVELSEPNVLVLDLAEYAFDHGEWRHRDDVLRIDNEFRELLGYPLRRDVMAQPWLIQEDGDPEHTLSLRYTIHSMVDVEYTELALENREAKVILNGIPVEMEETGWYTDEDIICRRLGAIHRGDNELIVELPFFKKQNVENMFLLGDFGVYVRGDQAVVTSPVRRLRFGDITVQGLPFYGGNVEYHIPFAMPEDGEIEVQATRFRSPLLKAAVDGGEGKVIAFSPYSAKLACTKGGHVLKLTAFGNRVNTFGMLHDCNDQEIWCGPNQWRTSGASWADEYQIKPTGILKTPEINILTGK